MGACVALKSVYTDFRGIDGALPHMQVPSSTAKQGLELDALFMTVTFHSAAQVLVVFYCGTNLSKLQSYPTLVDLRGSISVSRWSVTRQLIGKLSMASLSINNGLEALDSAGTSCLTHRGVTASVEAAAEQASLLQQRQQDEKRRLSMRERKRPR